MSQHDTLTLREALRSIQYEAASLADAQVIALQALNATYPASAALSATQPAQAAADARDAERWRKLEQSGFELIQRRSGKKTLWAARPAFTNYEYELHETAAQAVDAIAASGRQE